MPSEPLDGNSVILEELDSPNGGPPLRVVLAGRDAPLGGRGSGGAFDVAAELRQVVTHYPGQAAPSRQVMGVKYQPITFRGNLQDRGVVGRARGLCESLLSLATRGRRVRLTWGPWTWFGVVSRPKVSPEGLRDFNYEVEVDVDGPDLPNTALAVAAPEAPSTSNVGDLAESSLSLSGDPITEAGAALPATEAVGLAEAQLAHATATRLLLDVTDALTDSNSLTPRDAGRVISSCVGASQVAFGFAMVAQSIPGPLVGGWAAQVLWQKARTAAAESAFDLAGGCADTAGRLDELTRGEAEATHDVRDGETLESIARDRLGDEGRAGEIARRNNLSGYRPVAGQRLVLPAR